MYLRISTTRRGTKTYRYAQIVESYRGDNGVPTNRVICSLGQRSEAEIVAIKTVLDMARKGQRPVLPKARLDRVRVLHSLRYLDVAVLLRVWRRYGMDELLAAGLGRQRAEVSAAPILTALILQRCVAPASKLAASRWYGTTALPELQNIAPEQFNNSRIHRALSALEKAEVRLQQRLPTHIMGTGTPTTALFIDATDTWFEGHGPPLANRGKDKHGIFRQRVGLVLVCDQRGLPLRWKTLDGRFHDPTSLGDMAEQVAQLPWARDMPLVVDRALGSAGWVDKLDRLRLQYLTCVTDPELRSCGAPIPWPTVEAAQEKGEDIDAMRQLLLAHGFVPNNHGQYVRELGLFNKARPRHAGRISQAVATLQLIEQIESFKGTGVALARKLNKNRRTLERTKPLSSLGHEARELIRQGAADALTIKDLLAIAALPKSEQAEALRSFVAKAPARRRTPRASKPETFVARGALSVSPERMIEDRKADEHRLADVRARIDTINQRLASPRSTRKDSSAIHEAERVIRRHGLGNVCSVSMNKTADCRQLVLHVNDKSWRHRRLADGLTLIVSHPDVAGDALSRVKRYFSRHVIENDFRSIKSTLGLRPVRHRTDPKLRAHVTLCVLALLLSRLTEHAVLQRDTPGSIEAMINALEPIRLNLIADGDKRYYATTEPSDDARRILKALKLDALLDNATLTKEIVPR